MASVINQIKFNDIEYAIAASAYAECSTAADIAAKTATICTDGDTTNTGFALVKGVSVKVKFTATNTASSPTLNINGTGAKAIMYRGSAINKGYLAANRVYEFVYDGTDWELVGDINSAATQSADGLMSANDKKKLDEIASGATKITVDASLSSTSTNPIQNKIVNSALEAKTDVIKWSCPTKVGAYSCVCELSNYGTGILTLIFDQNSQAVVHTYMVGTSYHMAQLYQIGTDGYSIYADQIVRVVQGSSATKFIVEVLNNYGYSGATTVTAGCTYMPLTNSTTCTPYTAYTATSSAPTVKATVESKYNGIVAPNFYGNLVGNATSATTANTLTGLTYAGSSNDLTGNQTGTCLAYWKTPSNGGIWLRDNNPENGQVSLLIDGTVYVNNGMSRVLHTGNYGSYALPLKGGTMTGHLSLTETKNIILRPGNPDYTAGIGFDIKGDECIALWAKYSATRLRWYAGKDMTNMTSGKMMNITPDFEVDKSSGTVVGRLEGNTIIHSGNIGSQSVASATKLKNARTIYLTGDATGSTTFDGTDNAHISTTVKQATKATQDGNGNNIANYYLPKNAITISSSGPGSSLSSGTFWFVYK